MNVGAACERKMCRLVVRLRNTSANTCGGFKTFDLFAVLSDDSTGGVTPLFTGPYLLGGERTQFPPLRKNFERRNLLTVGNLKGKMSGM